MLNTVMLVGRLAKDVIVEEGKAKIELSVNRSYKNAEGIYETDFVTCYLGEGLASNTAEYCKKGDVMGIKGRVEGQNGEIRIIAEKVTFLSSGSKNDVAKEEE